MNKGYADVLLDCEFEDALIAFAAKEAARLQWFRDERTETVKELVELREEFIAMKPLLEHHGIYTSEDQAFYAELTQAPAKRRKAAEPAAGGVEE